MKMKDRKLKENENTLMHIRILFSIVFYILLIELKIIVIIFFWQILN